MIIPASYRNIRDEMSLREKLALKLGAFVCFTETTVESLTL